MKSLALLRNHYSICTSKHIYNKVNASSFQFTAHEKLLIFFFIGFIFQSSTCSCGHLSSLLFGDDQLINYSSGIDDFCLHLFQLFSLTFFVSAIEWLQLLGTNKVFKQLQTWWGHVGWKKKNRASIANLCCILCRRLGPWSCISKGCGVPISDTPPPSPLT